MNRPATGGIAGRVADGEAQQGVPLAMPDVLDRLENDGLLGHPLRITARAVAATAESTPVISRQRTREALRVAQPAADP